MNWLLKAAGLAAFLGGALRLYTAIIPDPPFAMSLWTLYLVIDVLLLVGWAGIYAALAKETGIPGAINGLTAAIALLTLIARDLFRLETYEVSAALLLAALFLMSLLMLRSRTFPRVVPWAWMAAGVAGVSTRFLDEHAPLAFQAAGGLFGLGFIVAGVTLMLRSAEPGT